MKSFDAFRVSKPIAKTGLKNEKAPIKKQSPVTRIVVEPTSDILLEDSSRTIATSPPPSVETPEIKRIELPQLDESDVEFLEAAAAIRDAKRTPVLHIQPNTIETILRDFDLTGRYGPCVGITRLERFERAQRMKMDPPAVIGKILRTQQAHDRSEYKQEVRQTCSAMLS